MKKIFDVLIFSVLGAFLSLGVSLSASEKRRAAQHDMVPLVSAMLPGYEVHIRELMQLHGLPGAAIGIATADRILFLKGYGVRSLDDFSEIDTETVFRIASLSKGFAATLAALQVEEGLYGWDDALSSVLQTFNPKDTGLKRGLTVAHVLSHQTGWVAHAYDNLIDAGRGCAEIERTLLALKPVHAPGQCYAYQNVAFNLIGDVLEHQAGWLFSTQVRYRLFQPLGMENASVGWLPYLTSTNRARPHRLIKGAWQVRKDKPHYYKFPAAAGVNASIHDMTLWLQAQMGGRPDILSPAVLAALHERRVATPGERRHYRWNDGAMHYGLGWRLFRFRGHEMVFHSGGLEGFFSQIGWMPELGVGIVVLHNSRRVDAMLPDFFDRLLDAVAQQKRLATSSGGGASSMK